MDDIIVALRRHDRWDREAFLSDFTRSECYWKPLKLEECAGDTFLESEFRLSKTGRLSCRLKNVNAHGLKVWRYHSYTSGLDYATKRATLLGTLKKVDRMASDANERIPSALDKCREFLSLGYPVGILRYMCGLLAAETGHKEWLRIKRMLPEQRTT